MAEQNERENQMAKITSKTEFAREVTFKTADGKSVQLIHQPYVIGIYVAVYVDKRIAAQSSVAWSHINELTEKKVRENIKDGATDVSITVAEVGQWLSESDISIVNG